LAKVTKGRICYVDPGIFMVRDDRERRHYVRIVSGNRVTLPEKFRELLELEEGDYLKAEIEVQAKRIVLTPAA